MLLIFVISVCVTPSKFFFEILKTFARDESYSLTRLVCWMWIHNFDLSAISEQNFIFKCSYIFLKVERNISYLLFSLSIRLKTFVSIKFLLDNAPVFFFLRLYLLFLQKFQLFFWLHKYITCPHDFEIQLIFIALLLLELFSQSICNSTCV